MLIDNEEDLMAMLRDETKYHLIPDVPILDEHLIEDDHGNTIDVVDEKKLNLIASNINAKIAKSADAVPIVIGHTKTGKMEIGQPPIVGFAVNAKVGPSFRADDDGKMLYADFYVRRKEYDNGVIEKYPRRSVELWTGKRWDIDPISILGATPPERDLGMLHQYSRKTILHRVDSESSRCTVDCPSSPECGPIQYSKAGDKQMKSVKVPGGECGVVRKHKMAAGEGDPQDGAGIEGYQEVGGDDGLADKIAHILEQSPVFQWVKQQMAKQGGAPVDPPAAGSPGEPGITEPIKAGQGDSNDDDGEGLGPEDERIIQDIIARYPPTGQSPGAGEPPDDDDEHPAAKPPMRMAAGFVSPTNGSVPTNEGGGGRHMTKPPIHRIKNSRDDADDLIEQNYANRIARLEQAVASLASENKALKEREQYSRRRNLIQSMVNEGLDLGNEEDVKKLHDDVIGAATEEEATRIIDTVRRYARKGLQSIPWLGGDTPDAPVAPGANLAPSDNKYVASIMQNQNLSYDQAVAAFLKSRR